MIKANRVVAIFPLQIVLKYQIDDLIFARNFLLKNEGKNSAAVEIHHSIIGKVTILVTGS
jgi:hypothetical protein